MADHSSKIGFLRPAFFTYDVDYKNQTKLEFSENTFSDLASCYFCHEEIGRNKMFRHLKLEHTKESFKIGKVCDKIFETEQQIKVEQPQEILSHEFKHDHDHDHDHHMQENSKETFPRDKYALNLDIVQPRRSGRKTKPPKSKDLPYLKDIFSKPIKQEKEGPYENLDLNQVKQENMDEPFSAASFCNAILMENQPESKIKINLPKCDSCGEYYTTMALLQQHKLNAHQSNAKQNVFQCTLCDKEYKHKKSLAVHIRIYHSKSNKHLLKMCTLCDKRFFHLSNLKDHLETHKPYEQRKKFNCQQCKNSYTTKKSLTKHIAFHHTKYNAHLKKRCNICSKLVMSNYNLKRHMETHMEDETRRKFQCQFCYSTFTRVGSLKDHVDNIHSKSNKHLIKTCKICNKKFRHAISLKRHLLESHKLIEDFKIQTDIKPSALNKMCQICDKTFTRAGAMIKHLDTHKPYEQRKTFDCQHCEKKYTRKETLDNHVELNHSKSKKHLIKTCHICKKKFLGNVSIRRHLKTHNPIEQRLKYQCQPCEKWFIHKSSLTEHLLNYH